MVVIKNGCSLLGLGILNLLYVKNESMNWADCLHAGTNLQKLKLALISIGWVWSEMSEALKIVGVLNQMYLTNDWMN